MSTSAYNQVDLLSGELKQILQNATSLRRNTESLIRQYPNLTNHHNALDGNLTNQKARFQVLNDDFNELTGQVSIIKVR